MPHVPGNPHSRVCCRRKKPGLRPQHLAGLRLIADISGGALQGDRENSSAVVLQPGRLLCRNALGDTGTAGSCALLAQVHRHSPASSLMTSVCSCTAGSCALLAHILCHLTARSFVELCLLRHRRQLFR